MKVGGPDFGFWKTLKKASIGKVSKYFNVWMPVLLYLSGVVIIFAFLDLGKNISFSDSLLAKELMKIRPDIPIILCTGFSENISEQKAKEIGIRGFSTKPFVMRDLAETTRRVLGREN
jgi:hypothetical protein